MIAIDATCRTARKGPTRAAAWRAASIWVTRAVELVATLALMSALALAAGRSAAAIEGPWLIEDRGSVIDIEPCGSLYCGQIVGLAAASLGNPLPKDVNGNSRCGLEIMQALAETDPGEWTGKHHQPGRRPDL